MPPTLAAATKTASGRWRSIHASTSAWRRRSSASRPAVRMTQSSRWRRRTMAEPTKPRWPATKTRWPVREKSFRAMSALLLDDAGKVGLHHLAHQFAECGAVVPSEDLVGLCGVAQQTRHLGRPEVSRVHPDDGRAGRGVERHLVDARPAPLDAPADMAERALDEFADRMRFAGRQHKVVGLVLLEHQPHALDIVARMAPVALRLEVAYVEDLLDSVMDRGDR